MADFSFADITALAVLQGVTEFLPVSSSGHLVLFQHALEVPERLRLPCEVFLHGGTLAAIFAYYAGTVWRLLRGVFAGERDAWGTALRLAASAVPAAGTYFLFHTAIDSMQSNTRMVGALLMFTGAMLLGTRLLPRGERKVDFWRALLMGAGQAVALLPGVSRSGMTLALARSARVSPDAAAEFSFLMSAPPIAGAMLLHLVEFAGGGAGEAGLPWGDFVWGAAVAAVVGYFSLKLLVKALRGKWFWLFGPYCLAAGLLAIVFG